MGQGVRSSSVAVLVSLLAVAGAATVMTPAAGRAPTRHRTVTRWKALPGKVSIRRTSYGIPHILAGSYFGAGEGYGFAFAQDNICTIANDYVTVDAQRSRYFGPNGGYTQGGSGVAATNLDSDFFFQQINDSGVIDRLLSTPPPLGPVAEVHQLLAGYVGGYNRY